jgi:pumilio family protein 6
MCEYPSSPRQWPQLTLRLIVMDSFNSTQKDALAQAIFHRLVLEYINCVYKFQSEEQADKKMHELLEA